MEGRRLLVDSFWMYVDHIPRFGLSAKYGISYCLLLLLLTRDLWQILYKAATRSFHSTRILRHLFTVHTYLAEFYLASKALDSYLRIVTKGKARVEKSGKREIGLDDDITAIQTAAAGIRMLCLYGRREDAERAQESAVVLEMWLLRLREVPSLNINENDNGLQQAKMKIQNIAVKHARCQGLATGYCALGISQAHWANLTYETSLRASLQAKAVSNLQTASEQGLANENNIEFLYPLASALSKTRDIDSAIEVLKKGLSNGTADYPDGNSKNDVKVEPDAFPDTQKRRLMLKSWHLLALLLSAKQNFSSAATSCEAALELYGFYSKSPGHSPNRDLCQSIEFCDKRTIIEIKMTQLALTEVIEGAEAAVSACEELLSLYASLFNYSENPVSESSVSAPDSSPASRHGTIKSFRGSFLSRSKGSRIKSSGSGPPQDLGLGSSVPHEIPKAMARTPTISVTAEDNSTTHNKSHHSHHLFHHESKKLHKRSDKNSESSNRRSRASSLNIAPASNGLPRPSTGLPLRQIQNDVSPPIMSNEISRTDNLNCEPDEVGVAISHDEPTSSRPSTARQSLPPLSPLMQFITPPQSPFIQSLPNMQTVPSQNPNPRSPPSSYIPYPHPPIPLFSPADQNRQSLTLLVKIWLGIASLYRHASMPADAQGALSEVRTHISTIKAAVAAIHSSAEAFATPGWGGVKSVSELWADLLTEQGQLHEMLGNQTEAESDYEKALEHFPDHPGAIVGLSTLLLDFYEHPFSPSPSSPSQQAALHPPPLLASRPPASTPTPTPDAEPDLDPSSTTLIPRLCARDRAYGLLSSMTKSGAGWDRAEAWFALARAYELSGQTAKARDALWWVVELEDSRPVREWPRVGD